MCIKTNSYVICMYLVLESIVQNHDTDNLKIKLIAKYFLVKMIWFLDYSLRIWYIYIYIGDVLTLNEYRIFFLLDNVNIAQSTKHITYML